MSKVKRYFMILPILCILLIPCTSFSVSAVDYNLKFNISEPIVDNWTGYIIQPRSNYSGSSYVAELYFWTISPLGDYSLSFPAVNYYFNGSSTTLQFTSSASDESYFVTVYLTTPGDSSTVIVKDSFVINQTTDRSITINLGNYDSFWRPQFKNVISADESWPTSGKSYSVTWGDDLAVYEELINANNKLTDLINSLDFTNDQLEQTYALLADYLNKIYLLDRSIEDTLTWLYDEFFWWSYEVTGNHERIIELLEQLIEGSEEFTESSTLSDEQNELNRVEDELLNNEAASSAQEDIKVEINANAMSYIWDLITQFLQSNSKVFGLVISVLSLGIIALILNR